MSRANVYTDGACINQDEANNRSGRVDGHPDSNRAELRAAHVAIKTAIDKGVTIYKSVTIHSDSQFVQDAITGSGNFQSAPANYRDLLQSTNDLVRHSKIQVNTNKVAAHSGVHGNDKAHQLATQGAKGN
ncbi:hypothetical protein L5515_010493 [Caenorhabditis briggsae]|uniref:ribonuclease H n=1 Tax=Caenorhabditis briggsae TaxID=6238 RepID=A0AAE9ESS9_CAEBR|nr:hypothetical protein L5515_010493 [Caenorhabditis briggsae]